MPRKPGTDRQPSQSSSISPDQRRQHRIDELGVGNGLGVGIALVVLEAEDDHLQQHADLRRGESPRRSSRPSCREGPAASASSSGVPNRVDRRRALQQSRIAHAKDVADHAAPLARQISGDVSSSARTLSIAVSSTSRFLPSTLLRAVAASRRVIDDDRDRRVGHAELARERRFRHAGHADQRRAVALQPVDFGGRLEPRARTIDRAIDAAVGQCDPGRAAAARQRSRSDGV